MMTDMAVMLILFMAVASGYFAPVVLAHGNARPWTPPAVPANVVAHDYPYELEGKNFTGYVAYPSTAAAEASQPGVLVAHQWLGLGNMEKWRCQQMASQGYVAFALDVYGTGVRPKDETAAREEMDKVLSNLTSFYDRLYEGIFLLQHLGEGPKVSSDLLFANGYCFGGQMVLELARRGYPGLKAVSSFHGELGNLTSQDNDQFEATVSVHHADLDYQKAAGLLNLEDELRNHHSKSWSTVKYGNCMHAWTDPTNENYRPFEARQSHQYMNVLYTEILGMKDS